MAVPNSEAGIVGAPKAGKVLVLLIATGKYQRLSGILRLSMS